MSSIRGVGPTQTPPISLTAANAPGSERAVAAQAQATGGALNLAAQSSVQTERDKSQENRRHLLLGQGGQALVRGPEAPHLEPHHDEGRPRGRVRYPRGRQENKDKGHGGSDGRPPTLPIDDEAEAQGGKRGEDSADAAHPRPRQPGDIALR